MQITITFEADTLEGAIAKLRASVRAAELDTYADVTAAPSNTFAAGLAPLEQLDDLKPADPPLTVKDVQAALKAVFSAKGEPAARKLLADFDAANVGEVPEAKRRVFIEAAKRMLS